ncbi:MAG: phytanoyl-CoA dioxygenase family protein [Acidimicrobiales bacterium]|jgi:hypothetical protein
MTSPGGADAVERWHGDGWCLLEGVFTPEEVESARVAVAGLFPPASAVAAGEVREEDIAWGARKPTFPFADEALNRLVVHDAVIDLAEELLGTDQLRLYQGMVSAKYPGLRDEYEQLLHVDYANHTLVVPRDDVGFQHLELFVYLSDVSPETAATRMVPRRLTGGIPVERTYLGLVEYASLYDAEVAAAGPAGSVLAYRPDVYHRGSAMTAGVEPRFLLHVAYKPVATDWIGFHTWPVAGEGMEWHRFVAHASVRQLTVLGFPEPGHPYWTPETLAGVGARYPALDMAPWTRGPAGGN